MGTNNAYDSNKSKKSYVIWIDRNIDDKEQAKYIKQLKDMNYFNIRCFKNVMESLTLIKSIRHEETNIILSGSLYNEFTEKFKENLADIFIKPKIIIFTSNKEKFCEKNKNYNTKDNSLYNLVGIQTSFENIKNFLIKTTNTNINNNMKNNNEINIIYKIKNEDYEIKIFDNDFVENNKD